MTLDSFLSLLGEEIQDVYEGDIFPPQDESLNPRNLGFVNRSVSSLSLTVAGQNLTIYQSPTLLSSSRQGGTTGAVLWKITPAFADWVCDDKNPLFTHGILSSSSSILELGSGSAAILGLTLGARVRKFVLSDQKYVLKLIQKNLNENLPVTTKTLSGSPKLRGNARRTPNNSNIYIPDISAISLDWETDTISHHPMLSGCIPFSAIIACDTIYNETLIKPFVDACIDACSPSPQKTNCVDSIPTIIIVAQELRSPAVFEHWLETFQKSFHTHRIPDTLLTPSLKSVSGYSVHIGILRSQFALSRN